MPTSNASLQLEILKNENTNFLFLGADFAPPRFSDLLRLLEELDPEELLDEEPERLEAEELLPELLPPEELPDDEPLEDFRVFFFTGDLPLDCLLVVLTGLLLSERFLNWLSQFISFCKTNPSALSCPRYFFVINIS